MRGKRMPNKVRAEAVALALVKGVPDAAKQVGVSQRNIRRWKLDPELSDLVLSAHEELLNTMKAAIWVGMEQIDKGLQSPDEPLKDKASTVFGLIDRHQLLSGAATSRTETVSLTDGLDPHAKRQLRERLARSVRGELEPSGAAGDPDGAGEPVDSAATPGSA
jgi:hypothetical protein